MTKYDRRFDAKLDRARRRALRRLEPECAWSKDADECSDDEMCARDVFFTILIRQVRAEKEKMEARR